MSRTRTLSLEAEAALLELNEHGRDALRTGSL